MKLNNFLEGINILRKYYKNPDGFHMGAEHDIFYMYPTDNELSQAHYKRLIELDWFQEEVGDSGVYEPSAGWAAFV